MSYTRTQKKEAYSQLPPEVQNFIMDNETTDTISDLLKKAGVYEEQSDLADSEILNTLFGLQSPKTAVSNIAKICNKEISQLSGLEEDLNREVFSKVEKDLKGMWVNEKPPLPKEKVGQTNTLGSSFEETILNQARGMMPAREVGSSQPLVGRNQVPENLPTENNREQEDTEKYQIPNRNYSGNDPYREPLE